MGKEFQKGMDALIQARKGLEAAGDIWNYELKKIDELIADNIAF